MSADKKHYAPVRWVAEDVQLCADISLEEAEEFLQRNAKHISEACIRAGFDAIQTCLSYEKAEKASE